MKKIHKNTSIEIQGLEYINVYSGVCFKTSSRNSMTDNTKT